MIPFVQAGQGNSSGSTVLIVDDDPFNRRMIVRALEHAAAGGHATEAQIDAALADLGALEIAVRALADGDRPQ